MKANRKIFWVFGLILAITTLSTASIFNIGLNMGRFNIDNDYVGNTFDHDFYASFYGSFMTDYGLEIRGGVGGYSNVSKRTDFPVETYDLKMEITPLTGSLLFHILPDGNIDPYLGAGVGAYFYTASVALTGNIEEGVVFGPHLLAGVKFKLSNYVYLNAQYEKHFIPSLLIDNADDFDSSTFTLGLGLSIPLSSSIDKDQVQTNGNNYKYSQQEEALLVEIEQVKTDLAFLRKDKQATEAKILELFNEEEDDDFWTDDETNSKKNYKKRYDTIKYYEKKIDYLDKMIQEKQSQLNILTQKWDNYSARQGDVGNNVVYLQKYYQVSPWGLNYNNGYFFYRNHPYQPPVYHYNETQQHNNNNSKPSNEEKKEYLKKKQEYKTKLKQGL